MLQAQIDLPVVDFFLIKPVAIMTDLRSQALAPGAILFELLG
ncbi:hypothetical protein GALL_539460 [mine drainage metagenome]|uniref:Uncharacterized protein n=1 Tax=mine drainage metagenome TaxID=410659 RepID=A0A1J5P1P2_9ZZZZ